MKIDDCYYLGYISKTQGFKGQLIIFLDVDNAAEYANLDSFLVNLNGTLTPFFIEQIQIRDKNFAQVKLEDVDDREMAITLSNNDIYLPLTELPELADDEYYLHELVGMKVNDKELGNIGMVEKVIDHTTNPLLQLLHQDEEILIPLIDEFIIKVDKAIGSIEVDLPEGLIEINKS